MSGGTLEETISISSASQQNQEVPRQDAPDGLINLPELSLMARVRLTAAFSQAQADRELNRDGLRYVTKDTGGVVVLPIPQLSTEKAEPTKFYTSADLIEGLARMADERRALALQCIEAQYNGA